MHILLIRLDIQKEHGLFLRQRERELAGPPRGSFAKRKTRMQEN